MLHKTTEMIAVFKVQQRSESTNIALNLRNSVPLTIPRKYCLYTIACCYKPYELCQRLKKKKKKKKKTITSGFRLSLKGYTGLEITAFYQPS